LPTKREEKRLASAIEGKKSVPNNKKKDTTDLNILLAFLSAGFIKQIKYREISFSSLLK